MASHTRDASAGRKGKRNPTYLERIISRARPPSALTMSTSSPPKQVRPSTAQAVQSPPTVWEREMSPGRIPRYLDASARAASPARELQEVTKAVLDEHLENVDDAPPTRAARMAANFGGQQLMGAETEKNVQRTRISKLNQRIAELERKIIHIRESAPVGAAETPPTMQSQKPCFADPSGGVARSGPIWEIADVLVRGGTRDAHLAEVERAELSKEETDETLNLPKTEASLSKALENMDNDGWEHTLESFTQVIRQLFSDTGANVYDWSQSGTAQKVECERRFTCFCRDNFVELIELQRKMMEDEGSVSTGDIDRVNVVEMRQMLKAELEQLDAAHVQEYLRADLDAAHYIARSLIEGGIISPTVLLSTPEDVIITNLDGVEGDIRRTLSQRIIEYQQALCGSSGEVQNVAESIGERADADAPADRIVENGDAAAAVAQMPVSAPGACMKYSVNGEGLASGEGYGSVPTKRHVTALCLALESYIGFPAEAEGGGDVLGRMQHEHQSDEGFYDSFHGLMTAPSQEWLFVTSEEMGVDLGDATPASCAGKRVSLPLRVLMKMPEVIEASLSHEEIVGLRLYTGPMQLLYNEQLRKVHMARRAYHEALSTVLNSAVLSEVLQQDNHAAIRFEEQQALLQRAGIDILGADMEAEAKYLNALRVEIDHQKTQRPLWLKQLQNSNQSGDQGQPQRAVLQVLVSMEALIRAQVGDNQFVTSIHVIASALNKLSALPPTGVLEAEGKGKVAWRALFGQRLPAGLRVGAHGERVAIELGFTSATFDPEQALASTGRETRNGFPVPILFKIELGWQRDHGTPLAWISQFPSEAEVAFRPLSCVEVCGPPRLTKIATSAGGKWAHVYTMRIRESSQRPCVFDPDGRARILQQDYDERLLLELSRDLNLQLKIVAENEDTTPERLALAGALADQICMGAHQVLSDPTAAANRKDTLGKALKAFEVGKKSGFTISASELLSQHQLTAAAAAAEMQRSDQRKAAQTMQSLCVQMLEAAEEGQTEKCENLLQEGSDVNYSTKRGLTALHKAAARGHIPTVELLLNNNADINRRDARGASPFSCALSRRKKDMIAFLLSKGSEAGGDALDAVNSANVHALKLILEAAPELADTLNGRKESLLYLGVCSANVDMVQELLSAGADVNGCTASLPGIVDVDDSPDLVEGTPTAEDGGKRMAGASEVPDMPVGDDAQAAAVKIQAIARGKRDRARVQGIKNVTDNEGEETDDVPVVKGVTGLQECKTPLARAVEMEHVEIVQMLLQGGADLLLPTSISHQTALHICIKMELMSVVDLLLAAAENGNLLKNEKEDLLSAQDQLGNTALHTGVMTGNLEVVEKLIASCKAGGRALNACNADGASALILACKSASSSEGDDDLEKIAIALVNHGADKARAREEFPEFGFLDGADILQVGDDADDEQAAAAVKIQSIARGKRDRQRVDAIKGVAGDEADGETSVIAQDGEDPELDPEDSAVGAVAPELANMDTAEHAKAALKIQNRARVKNAEKETARLKAEGKLPGQLRAKKIEEWGMAIFKKFDADADGKLTSKELASALKDLPKTKPKTVPPGVKFQSVQEMMNEMDSDSSGSLDLAEWLANLGQCPGLAAALAENVTVGEDTQEISVSAEEVKAVGDMVAAGEIDMPSGEDAERAAVKIQAIARGKRDRARVDGIKSSGEGTDDKTEGAAEAAGGDGAAEGAGVLDEQ